MTKWLSKMCPLGTSSTMVWIAVLILVIWVVFMFNR